MASVAFPLLGFLTVVLTFGAVGVSFAVPEWILKNGNNSRGLWLECQIATEGVRWSGCQWFFENDLKLENSLPIWYKAVQGIYSAALAFAVLSLLIGSCACVCQKGCKVYSLICGLMNCTFLLLVASVTTFGAEAYIDDAEWYDVRVMDSMNTYGWGFWVAVGATGMSLISTVSYYFLSRRLDFKDDYFD